MESAKQGEHGSLTLNRMDATTLGDQLRAIFREKISSGEWSPGSMIPSENKLCEIYGVSRMTVRGVISQFVSQGFLYRIAGKGTFVCDSKMEISSLQYSGIRGQLEAMGHSVETTLISCEQAPCDEYTAKMLTLHIGEDIYVIKRTRRANGIAVSYHESYVPVKLCPNLKDKPLERDQLCKIMSTEYLLQRSRVVETLESFAADRMTANYLDVTTGFPLLLLQDQLYSADGTLYEYSKVYFRGDKIKLRIEYRD